MGILLRSSIAESYFHPSWKQLPEELVNALKRPPLPTTWTSTVLTDAVFCVVADTFHPNEEAVLKWSYERTLRLANLPMYSTLTRLSGVRAFLKLAARVHALFQRGTDLFLDVSPGQADVVLRHAPHLHGRLNHLSNEGVFRAALESAGARSVRVTLVASEPTYARYDATFQDGP